MIILGLILGGLVGALIVYAIIAPRLSEREEENFYIRQSNQEAVIKAEALKAEIEKLEASKQTNEQEYYKFEVSLLQAQNKKEELEKNVEELQELTRREEVSAQAIKIKATDEAKQITDQAIAAAEAIRTSAQTEAESIRTQSQVERQAAQAEIDVIKEDTEKAIDAIYNSAYELMQETLSHSAEKESIYYQEQANEYTAKYLSTLQESAQAFTDKLIEYQAQLDTVRMQLAAEKAIATAAINARLREQEKKERLDFYTLGITTIDMEEIKRLRAIIPYLRNARPINKAIWEAYYQRKTNELIGRVIGTEKRCGIYKITNIYDDKVYIGQSLDIAERWKEHIKAGLGIDTPNSKLYTAMLKDGVENYTFEIMEICSPLEKDDREKYWIDFYQSNSVGYNETSGGAKKCIK